MLVFGGSSDSVGKNKLDDLWLFRPGKALKYIHSSVIYEHTIMKFFSVISFLLFVDCYLFYLFNSTIFSMEVPFFGGAHSFLSWTQLLSNGMSVPEARTKHIAIRLENNAIKMSEALYLFCLTILKKQKIIFNHR